MMHSKKKVTEDDFIIERFFPVVEAIAKTFGKHCEVVLHDLRQLDKSVVKIEHGHLTGRKVGSSVTDLALRSFKQLKENMIDDVLLNYKTRTRNGKTLKSTTVLIRNRKNEPIAGLCINIDVTYLQAVGSIINELCQTAEEKTEIAETFQQDMNTTIGTVIDNVVSASGISVPIAQKDDRVKVVAKLDEQGIFLVKGAVKIVANKLNVSKYAVYSYLDEIRSRSGLRGDS